MKLSAQRVLVAAATAVVMGTAGWTAWPAHAADDDPALSKARYLHRSFIVTCAYSHSSMDDPIGRPGQPGTSHLHDFFGNTDTDAFSTQSSMEAGDTTCNRRGDTAGYWMPAVLEDGAPVTPQQATFYYRAVGPDPAAVHAFPVGFKMIAGDPEATSAQPVDEVEWACREEGAKKPWRPDIPQCGAGTDLAFRVNFPDCWNGRDLDSADHRSHVAYSTNRGRCPKRFPVAIPEVAMTAIYPNLHGGALTLSGHGVFAGHADFWNTWQPGTQEALVDSCLRASRDCYDYAGPGLADATRSVSASSPDRPSGVSTTTRVSPADPGTSAQEASISADGSTVAYVARGTGPAQVVVRSGAGTTTASVTGSGAPGDGDSWSPSVSRDGRYVAFASDARNLVAGDTNRLRDVFVRDLRTGTTTRVGGAAQPNGTSAEPAISDDGQTVAFSSFADNLVPGDANRKPDVFAWSAATGAVRMVSVTPAGRPGDDTSVHPDISGDGRWVTFDSWSRGLDADDTNKWQDVFVRDLSAGTTDLVSRTAAGRSANSSSYGGSVSDDGRYVVFESAANDLSPRDLGFRDAFVRDRQTGTTTRLSGAPGQRVLGLTAHAVITGDGSQVVFHSANASLAGNASTRLELYAMCRDGSRTRLLSAGGDWSSAFPSVDADGTSVAFESTSSTTVAGATAGDLEVYRSALSPAAC